MEQAAETRRPAIGLARRPSLGAGSLAIILGVLASPGCDGDNSPAAPRLGEPPEVRLVKPEARAIVRIINQPGFVDTYEQTAIYPKMTAYLEKWIVDIGDPVKKGEVMATLFVPELREEHSMKQAELELARQVVLQSDRLVDVAGANVKTAVAQVSEAEANLGKYQAEVDRWESEVKRLTGLVQKNVVDKQVLDESSRQLKSNVASRDAARATIQASGASQLSSQAELEKSKVDVDVAKAKVRVAEADVRRLAALVGYLQLTAPYDGIIVARNANTGDFVLPATGDPSASSRAPDVSTGGAAPIYVVARTDLLRIYVDVPEADANFVVPGTRASVMAKAFADRALPAKVTRTSWALNVKSRTLRAEIDLPNPDRKILPGMYAYGSVYIDRPNVRALPTEAITPQGDNDYCWLYEGGKARQIAVETGISDGDWVEVTRRRDTPAGVAESDIPWAPFRGDEQVIVGDVSELTDGETVRIAAEPARGAPRPPEVTSTAR